MTFLDGYREATIPVVKGHHPRDVPMAGARDKALASSILLAFYVENTNVEWKMSCHNRRLCFHNVLVLWACANSTTKPSA